MAAAPVVLSHWYKLLENLQASPMEFYGSVEQAVERRQVPDTERTRVDYFEGGAFSAKREYLRVRRGRLVFDICGAPFGTGFFVSWWLGELRSGPLMLLAIVAGMLFVTSLIFRVLGAGAGLLFFFVGVPAILWFLARHTPEELAGWDDPILVIPWIGPLYERWFRPLTYYKIDTTLMFQQAVHASVLDIVDDLTNTKGLRALSEDERKPILGQFFQR